MIRMNMTSPASAYPIASHSPDSTSQMMLSRMRMPPAGLPPLAAEPAAQLLVHRGMTQKVEVAQAAEVVAILDLEGNPPLAALAGGARVEDEQVADGPSERGARLTGQRRADEVVLRPLHEWDLAAAVGEQLVRIAVGPVLLQDR